MWVGFTGYGYFFYHKSSVQWFMLFGQQDDKNNGVIWTKWVQMAWKTFEETTRWG
jgi:hypothetical protein